MNYYVLNANSEIEIFDTDKSRLQSTLKFKPELQGEKIHQTTKEIVVLNNKPVFADEHQEEIEEKKQHEEDEVKQHALELAIDELIKEMAKADLMGDEDWKNELRAEYEALITESEADTEGE